MTSPTPPENTPQSAPGSPLSVYRVLARGEVTQESFCEGLLRLALDYDDKILATGMAALSTAELVRLELAMDRASALMAGVSWEVQERLRNPDPAPGPVPEETVMVTSGPAKGQTWKFEGLGGPFYYQPYDGCEPGQGCVTHSTPYMVTRMADGKLIAVMGTKMPK